MSIVMLGDSLTEYGSWEALLDLEVHNFGIAGDTTQGVLHRLGVIDMTPSKIFVMIGINDLLWQVSPAQVVENIESILYTLQKNYHEAEIFLQSILPVYSEAKVNQNVHFANERLASFCEMQSIKWLNFYEYFADSTGSLRLSLTTDGVHLSDEGYALWSSKLKEYC